MSNKEKLTVVYHDDYLNWLLGPGDGTHPTNPIRAKLATEMLVEQLGEDVEVISPVDELNHEADLLALKETHSEEYVAEVLRGVCTQWNGTKPIMGETAFKMFRGTIRAVEKILSGESKVAFNPQGAKHHAKTSGASGFCVFNDMAYAARTFQTAGLRPLYLDWDIHAGDGVAHMLRGSGMPCISIHNGSTFPNDTWLQNEGTGELHHPVELNYNFNLRRGASDDEFKQAISGAKEIIDAYKPDVILLAAGADGHFGASNLTELAKFTAEGFSYAAEIVAEMAIKHADGRVLIGGAGGYQPLKETPETWALVVSTIYNQIRKGLVQNG
jgi:acetoin utilization protein AcuC